MFYVKNLGPKERFIRVSAAVIVCAIGFFYFEETYHKFLVLASSLGFAFTGFIGWCPMCSLVGRKKE